MRTLLFFLIAVFLSACSNSVGVSPFDYSARVTMGEDTLPGMVRVNTGGAWVALGTNNPLVRLYERPEMNVRLNYDFSMGKHEVTCGEYNKRMKRTKFRILTCPSDSFPATTITFYDAVLYANELSKAEGFDTVYTYNKAEFDVEYHCSNLEGFVFRPEVKGYRLPTEAEWALVAAANWDMSKGWTAENSKYKLHDICGKADTSSAFCDLIGNAAEWVNDWLGNFRDMTVTNYVGAPDGGVLGQRIVKGGSYRHSRDAISIYSRGDIYTVTSSTYADYVGFRLAFGPIPDATWMDSDGKASKNRIVPLASSTTIHSETGTFKVKLAFRDDMTGNLNYIDYTGGFLSNAEIVDTLDVYHPEISPDGEKVAFCTRFEGVPGKSELYVRDLNAEGTNLVKLDVESAAIPRWRVLENGDTVIVYVTDADNNKDEAAFKKGSTWQVKFENGKFGKPEKLFDGAYHDGISEDNTLAVSGARLLRARIARKGSTVSGSAVDTVWYDSAQACNASLSKDGSKRTLFLDFGGKPGQKFVGEKYDIHERLLIADSTGKLIQSVAAPDGYSFDHSEWASGRDSFVVATLTNANGAHKKIVLVNLSDSNIVDLAEGDELWHPSLWVIGSASKNKGAQVDLDSAGAYFEYHPENLMMAASVELAMKLQAFWAQRKDIECVVLGSSMLMDAVIDTMITSYKTLNMGVTLSDVHLFKYLMMKYILPYAQNTKILVVELAPGLMFRSQFQYLKYIREYSPGLIYDENHLDSTNADTIAAISWKYSYPKNLFVQDYMKDTFLLPSNSWGDTYVDADIKRMGIKNFYLNGNLGILGSMKEEAEKRNIKLILAITPRNPAFAETESFGLFGPSREVANQIIEKLENNGFEIFDENKDGKHDYPPEMAYNSAHLSYLGAYRFTARLDSLLKTLK